MFSVSWNAPDVVPPSPMNVMAARRSSRYLKDMATPSVVGSAWGRWLTKPMMPRSISPTPCRLASRPLLAPIARPSMLPKMRSGDMRLIRYVPRSRCIGATTSSGPSASPAPTEIASWPRWLNAPPRPRPCFHIATIWSSKARVRAIHAYISIGSLIAEGYGRVAARRRTRRRTRYESSSFSILRAATVTPTAPMVTRKATWPISDQSNTPRVTARMISTP